MTAEDMFKQLGYEQEHHIAFIKYYNSELEQYIWFYQDSETIEILFNIDMKLLQAINQQVKELGWYE